MQCTHTHAYINSKEAAGLSFTFITLHHTTSPTTITPHSFSITTRTHTHSPPVVCAWRGARGGVVVWGREVWGERREGERWESKREQESKSKREQRESKGRRERRASVGSVSGVSGV